MKRYTWRALCSASTALVALGTSAALAQNEVAQPAVKPRAQATEEIVVTAVRGRGEVLQKTPVAVTAITAKALAENHVTSFADVGKLAPNLQIEKSVSTGDVATIYLRGFGTYGADIATEPKVAVFVDGIYQPAAIGTLFDTFDIQQLEVQAGPQGTLLGKNAPIGAIYVATEQPTNHLTGTGQVDYGSYGSFAVHAKVSGPLITDVGGNTILAGRVSFEHKSGGDWVTNLYDGMRKFGGQNSNGGRVSLKFTPTQNFEWSLTGVVVADDNPQTGARQYGYAPAVLGSKNTVAQPASAECFLIACTPQPYGTTDSAVTAPTHGRTYQVASNMRFGLAPVTLVSVLGYDGYRRIDNEDVDGTPASVLDVTGSHARFDQESAEFRVRSNKAGGADLGGRLDWIVGGFFSHFNYFGENKISIFAPDADGNFSGPAPAPNVYQAEFGNTKSEAVFAQAVVHITDKLSSTLGLRSSWDQKEHSYISPGSLERFYDPHASFHNTSFEAGLSYQIDPSRLVYFRFAQGYAAGGFVGFPGCGGCGNIFQPETNDSYEVGLKTDWLAHKLRVNVNLFRNELSNLQVAGTVATDQAPFYLQTTTNAAAATVQGVESQIAVTPVHGLNLFGNIGYLDTKYSQYNGTVCSNLVGVAADCSGVPFAFAPKWTIDVGGDVALMDSPKYGQIRFSSNWSYKSTLYTADAPVPSSKQGSYGLLGLTLAYTDPSEHWMVQAFGTNVLNRKYTIISTGVPGVLTGLNDGRPAEFGLQLRYHFG